MNEGIKKPAIKFIFIYANDVEQMRNFYTNILGLEEVCFINEGGFGYINYNMGGFEFMIFKTDKPIPIHQEWQAQPGYPGGTGYLPSWSVIIDKSCFESVVQKCRDAGLKTFSDKPEWRQESYWGFTVADPMGNTVEIYTPGPGESESGQA
jgi:catechol 2,3-dioxygenase-like lactoylglutathione lyase family enzyme